MSEIGIAANNASLAPVPMAEGASGPASVAEAAPIPLFPEAPGVLGLVSSDELGTLGHLAISPIEPIEKTLDPATASQDRDRWRPVMLEEGWEKEMIEFGLVLGEVALDVIVPVEVPRSELTAGPGEAPQKPKWFPSRKLSIYDYL